MEGYYYLKYERIYGYIETDIIRWKYRWIDRQKEKINICIESWIDTLKFRWTDEKIDGQIYMYIDGH